MYYITATYIKCKFTSKIGIINLFRLYAFLSNLGLNILNIAFKIMTNIHGSLLIKKE